MQVKFFGVGNSYAFRWNVCVRCTVMYGPAACSEERALLRSSLSAEAGGKMEGTEYHRLRGRRQDKAVARGIEMAAWMDFGEGQECSCRQPFKTG